MTFKEELMEILREELETLKEIKQLSFDKTDVIINNQVKDLENITKREEELLNIMAKCEKNRLNLLNTWGVDKNTSLSEVIEKIPDGKNELIDIGEQLSRLLRDIQTRNNLNRDLIFDNLQWLDFNMNLLTQAGTPVTYDNKNSKAKAGKSLFDRKV